MDQTNRVPEALDTFGHPAASAVHLLCDRHSADSIALTHISAEGSISDITYGDLHELSCRAAGALAALG
ncbi:MAG TPA: AMP-dependent synthetase, partial [Chloroflexota bacterium]